MASSATLFDSIVRQRINVQRAGRRTAAAVLRVLADEDARLVEVLRQRLPHLKAGDIGAARIKELLRAVRELRTESFGKVRTTLREDLLELARIESEAMGRMAGAVMGGEVFNPVRAEAVRFAATGDPFAGGRGAAKTLSQWVGDLATGDRQRLLGAVQMGVRRQELVDTMVRRIAGTRALKYQDGILAVSRRAAETVAITAVNHVANAAQVAWGESNSDVVVGWEWTSVLDGRTCPECGTLNGGFVPNGDGTTPRGMKVLGDRSPPAHPRCRCALIPVFNFDRVAARLPDQLDVAPIRPSKLPRPEPPRAATPPTPKPKRPARAPAPAVPPKRRGAPARRVPAGAPPSPPSSSPPGPSPVTPPQPLRVPTSPAPSQRAARSVPRPTPEQVAKEATLLRDGSPLSVKPLSGGTSGSYHMVLSSKDGVTGGVWKPSAEEADGLRSNIATGTFHKREVAASELADLFDVRDLVPVTIEREVDGGVGSMQKFAEGAQHMTTGPKGRPVNRDAMERARVFDYVMGNTDRHLKNVMWREDEGELVPVLIDNGLLLPKGVPGRFIQPMPFMHKHTGPLLPATMERIAKLDPMELNRQLKAAGIEPEARARAAHRLLALKRDPDMLRVHDRTDAWDESFWNERIYTDPFLEPEDRVLVDRIRKGKDDE